MTTSSIILDQNIKAYTDVNEATLTRVINELQGFKMPASSEKDKLSDALALYVKSRGSSYFPKKPNNKTSRCLTKLWHFFNQPEVTLRKLKFAVYAMAQLQLKHNPISEADVLNQIFKDFNQGESHYDPLQEYGSLEMIAFRHQYLKQKKIDNIGDTSIDLKASPSKT